MQGLKTDLETGDVLHPREPPLLQRSEDPPNKLTEDEFSNVHKGVDVLPIQQLIEQKDGSDTCHLHGQNAKDHVPERVPSVFKKPAR
jgi:hypothetical protein